MHPRYFVGVRLPKKIEATLVEIQKSIPTSADTLKPLLPHITVLPPNLLMQVSPMYMLPQIKNRYDELLPAKLKLTKVDMFGKSVLYVAVQSKDLLHIHQKLSSLLPEDVKARYMVGRTFTPHITIAQAKPLQELDEILQTELTNKIKTLLPTTLTINELHVFNRSGARSYNPEPI